MKKRQAAKKEMGSKNTFLNLAKLNGPLNPSITKGEEEDGGIIQFKGKLNAKAVEDSEVEKSGLKPTTLLPNQAAPTTILTRGTASIPKDEPEDDAPIQFKNTKTTKNTLLSGILAPTEQSTLAPQQKTEQAPTQEEPVGRKTRQIMMPNQAPAQIQKSKEEPLKPTRLGRGLNLGTTEYGAFGSKKK